MKQNLGYEIDYIESKIIVSKKFLKEASTVNTPAYIELTKVRKDYPDFAIEPRQITKRENKMTYGKLTYRCPSFSTKSRCTFKILHRKRATGDISSLCAQLCTY